MDDRGMNVYVTPGTLDGPRGRWLRLPMGQGELADALDAMGAVDGRCQLADFEGDGLFDDLAFTPRDDESVTALNDLAWLAQDLSDFELEAAGTLVNDSCPAPTALQFANAVIQVDDIPFFDYGPTFDASAKPEENYARLYVDGYPGGLAQKLEESGLDCFVDWEAFGRDKAMNCVLSDNGYLDCTITTPDLDLYGRDEVSDLAASECARQRHLDEER